MIGTANDVEGTWLVKVNDDGVPISEFVFIPVETVPDVAPFWTIDLPNCGDAGIALTDD